MFACPTKSWFIPAAALLSWAIVWGYPQPTPAPRGWQLDFEYGPLRQVRLARPGAAPKTYWYLSYTVTNNTGRDLDFYPRCQLFTDTGQLFEAMSQVDALAYPDIAPLLGRELLEEELFVRGKLLQGEENARESVIILKDFDPQAVSFQLFISGLSDEVIWVEDPMTRQRVALVKTLQLSYGLGGQRGAVAEMVAELKDEQWIMR